MNAQAPPASQPRHVLSELGFSVHRAGDGLTGSAAIVPQMWVPGTAALRTSILAIWADTLTGLLSVDVIRPRVPVTLQLEVHVYRPLIDVFEIRAEARRVKQGKTVVVSAVDFFDECQVPLATATGLFMVNADPSVTLPPGMDIVESLAEARGPLQMDFAELVGCRRTEPGRVSLDRRADGLNASGTVNGGLLALLVEEAALSAQEPRTSLAMMTLRYLRPVRLGPAAATAVVSGGLAEVTVVDHGRGDSPAMLATTRSFPHNLPTQDMD